MNKNNKLTILALAFCLGTIFIIIYWNMVKTDAKLIENNEIGLLVISTTALLEFNNVETQIDSSISNSDSLILKISGEMKNALENEKYRFVNSDKLDYLSINSLFLDKSKVKKNISIARGDAATFLEKILALKGNISRIDADSLLNYYFYYLCVVSFNKYWYIQPLMPISNSLKSGLTDIDYFFKKIYYIDSVDKILFPIKIDSSTKAYNLTSKIATEELFVGLLKLPNIGNEAPRNLEIDFLQEFKRLTKADSAFRIGVLYYPK